MGVSSAQPAAGPTVVTVDSWSCPTVIHAGAGVLGSLGTAAAQGPVVLAVDERLRDPGGPVIRALQRLSVVATASRRPGDDDRGYLGHLRAVLADHEGATVVAVGGGSVLDPARIAGLLAREPGLEPVLARALGTPTAGPDDARTGGLVSWPGSPSDCGHVVAVPTTIGTAAEVSPVAVLRLGTRTVMLAGPALRSRTAFIDPELTASLPRAALACGLLEPLSRAIVPAITGSALALQDRLAAGLAQTLIQLGAEVGQGQDPGRSWRLAAALTSTQTHTSFLALGRSPFGHVLWPFATELSACLGVTKPVALGALMPTWLEGIGGGDLGPQFGSPQRVHDVLGTSPGVAAARMAEWVANLGLPAPTGPLGRAGAGDAAVIARRVLQVWQQPFLPGVSPAQARWLVGRTLQRLAS